MTVDGEVALAGWLRIRSMVGVVGKRGMRSGGGEGRAKIAAPSKRRGYKRRIVWS